ncbi:hypothetical protein RWE15_03540 [Virgibacillus halophilus]|uniref:Uncharacterized protein n=2 Tax=Tigheibacillus halophilus TaxID=361280 RepID=A0ABU5C4S3_9BACI|nr:hypothetical protein [Virgibacillus halophilus]
MLARDLAEEIIDLRNTNMNK